MKEQILDVLKDIHKTLYQWAYKLPVYDVKNNKKEVEYCD